jgi:predicted CoA-binding protein
MDHDSYPAAFIRDILNSVKTVAMVGASANDVRPSHFVMKYLMDKGYRVTPVNPAAAGDTILDQPVYGKLSDVREPIDMVDVFRNSDAALGITREALTLVPLPQVIWMQLGVRNDEAAALAEAAGLKVVMNRCPKMEYGKLSGEWAWIGGNSGILSSKKQILHKSGRVQSLGIAQKG